MQNYLKVFKMFFLKFCESGTEVDFGLSVGSYCYWSRNTLGDKLLRHQSPSDLQFC